MYWQFWSHLKTSTNQTKWFVSRFKYPLNHKVVSWHLIYHESVMSNSIWQICRKIKLSAIKAYSYKLKLDPVKKVTFTIFPRSSLVLLVRLKFSIKMNACMICWSFSALWFCYLWTPNRACYWSVANIFSTKQAYAVEQHYTLDFH